jgi:hypothetical protein
MFPSAPISSPSSAAISLPTLYFWPTIARPSEVLWATGLAVPSTVIQGNEGLDRHLVVVVAPVLVVAPHAQ